MSETSGKATLICRLKSSVNIDVGHFKNATFSMRWVADGKPHIVQTDVPDEYHVVLYDKECGVLDEGSSKALNALAKLSVMSVKSEAYVGMDSNDDFEDHYCLAVVVNVLAPVGLAQMVVSTIVSAYGSTKWGDHLTISNRFASDRHISKLLWSTTIKKAATSSMSKRSSGRSHSTTSILETAKKRMKVSNNVCTTEKSSIVDLTSAVSVTDSRKFVNTNIGKRALVDKKSHIPSASASNTSIDKTNNLLRSIQTQLSDIKERKRNDTTKTALPSFTTIQSTLVTQTIKVSKSSSAQCTAVSDKYISNNVNCVCGSSSSNLPVSILEESTKNDSDTIACIKIDNSLLHTTLTLDDHDGSNDIPTSFMSTANKTSPDLKMSHFISSPSFVSASGSRQNFSVSKTKCPQVFLDSEVNSTEVLHSVANLPMSIIQESVVHQLGLITSEKFSENGTDTITSDCKNDNIYLPLNEKVHGPEKLNISNCNMKNLLSSISKKSISIENEIFPSKEIELFTGNSVSSCEVRIQSLMPFSVVGNENSNASDKVHLLNGDKEINGNLITSSINSKDMLISQVMQNSVSSHVSYQNTRKMAKNKEWKDVKLEPMSPKKLVGCSITDVSTPAPSGSRIDFDEGLGLFNNDNSMYTSDLPENIRRRLQGFAQPTNFSISKCNTDMVGLTDLMDERGCSNICNFLLGRTSASSLSHIQQHITSSLKNTEDDNLHNDDDELNFPSDFLSRRNKKRDKIFDDDLPNGEIEDVVPVDQEPTVIKDGFDELFDLLSEYPKHVVTEPCQSILSIMLPHQKMALNWMILKENAKELPPFWECIQEGSDYFNLGTHRRIYDRPKSIKGGILADDMGLGKTLTTIALILTNHVNGNTIEKQKNILPMDASEICDDLPYTRKKRNSLKVNSTEKKELKKPGFLFRQIYLEKMKKKKKNTPVIKKENEVISNSMFLNDDDEEDNVNTTVPVDSILGDLSNKPSVSTSYSKFSEDDKNRKSTLIVCPMSVLSNWTDQLEQHVQSSLNLQIYLYYGPERIKDVEYLKKHDIIITTYGTLSCDYRAEKTKGKAAPLHCINWLRVVLDEGHIIRNFRSQQALAAVALNATRRWVLTGTVVQNRMTDLWSMIKFLHIEPFSDRKWWNQNVSKSLERRAGPGEVYFNRIQKIVKHIAIRRVKTDEVNGKPLVQLPKREVIIKWVKFSVEERKVYDGMQKDGKFVVSRYFRMNTVFKNYANILVIIMRLRQLCCHPKLCTRAIEKLEQAQNIMENLKEKIDDINVLDTDLNDEGNAISDEERQKLVSQIMLFLASGDSEECAICLEILREPVITRCAHIYCSTCINDVIENADGAASCPLCRSDIDQSTLLNVPIEENSNEAEPAVAKANDDEEWQSSAKIDLLIEMLSDIRNEDPNTKSLVVSQFTSFLDIIQKPLQDAGFQFVRLDGRMKQTDRVSVMEEFKDTDGLSPTIMLLSLTAGGVGLNLTSANRVFLLDPAWNPAVEEQCFDRCHRLGQTKDVKIYKFIVKETVEDRMLILQEKKRKLMQKAFGGVEQNANQRRQAALRDISTLLDLNLHLQNNPQS